MGQVLIDYWPSILALTGIQVAGVISPGPDLAIVVRNSLIYSRKAGVVTAIGVAFGIFVHLAYILLGLGIFINKTPWLFHIFQYLGAGYLLYIGVKGVMARKGALTYGNTHQRKDIGTFAALRSGFLTNALNAKCMLFFLSILSAFLTSQEPVIIVVIYGAILFLTTLIWFLIVALCFSHKQLRTSFSNLSHWVERVTGVLLALLGIRMLFMVAGPVS